jgi:hypothetical protein
MAAENGRPRVKKESFLEGIRGKEGKGIAGDRPQPRRLAKVDPGL